MGINRIKGIALGLSLSALMLGQAAHAQAEAEACVQEADLADAVVYAVPILTKAMRGKCGATLSSSGFMARQGDAFMAPYTARQADAWPGALRMLSQFAGEGKEGEEMMQMFGSLPAETVRPLFDAIIEQKVAEEIKVADCARIERGVELLSPLPPENVSGLVTFLLGIAKVDNPKLCPAPN